MEHVLIYYKVKVSGAEKQRFAIITEELVEI